LVTNETSVTGHCIIKICQTIAVICFHLSAGPEYWFGDDLGTMDPEESAQLEKEKELKLWRDQNKVSKWM
jgi:hypothetical protein